MFFSINNLLGSFLTILDQQKNLHGKVDKLDKLPYSFSLFFVNFILTMSMFVLI